MVAGNRRRAGEMPDDGESRSTSRRVSTGLGLPARPDADHPSPGSTSSTAAAGTAGESVPSMTASNRRSGSRPPEPCGEAECPGPAASRPAERPMTCTSAPRMRANAAASRPIVPGPKTATRTRWRQAGRRPPRAVSCRRARPWRRPVADRVGQGVQARRRDHQLLGDRAVPATEHADLEPVLADVLAAARQRSHRPQPSMVSPVTRCPSHRASTSVADRGDHAGPFVPGPQRVAGLAGRQVRHPAV